MAPKRQLKKVKRKVSPPSSVLPKTEQLSRELLPNTGITTLKDSVLKNLPEFHNVNEYLPSLALISEKDINNLKSPLESFTIIGSKDAYNMDIIANLKDIPEQEHIPIFLKRVHLVEPIKVMEGQYILPSDGALPQKGDAWKQTLTKIHNPYNEAYVDVLCAASLSRLVETGKSPHWTRFYGTFNGRVEKYLYNLTDEYSSLRKARWFNKNKKAGVFSIVSVGDNPYDKPPVEVLEGESDYIDCDALDMSNSTRASSLSSCASDGPETDNEADLEVLSERLVRIIKLDENKKEINSVYDASEDTNNSDNSNIGSSDESISKDDTNHIDETSSEDENSISDGESESKSKHTDFTSKSTLSNENSIKTSSSENNGIHEERSNSSCENVCEFYAQFKDFPVQATLYERCDDTMDSLLDIEEDNTDEDYAETKDMRWAAWIFQVIAGLAVAQHYFGFVHNDLHTNNVMWCKTNDTYIYYKLDEHKYYRVPTYGKIMKIIDFGRASYWLINRKELIITDSYDEGNDAAGQYNCPPFYDPSESRVDPNPSFDLCRLAVSMFDSLFPEQPGLKTPEKIVAEEPGRISYETESELYNILWRWLTDEEGKNILRTPDDYERFPDFDLYKHIAKYAKNCVPSTEALNPYFDGLFNVGKENIPEWTMLWEIPI